MYFLQNIVKILLIEDLLHLFHGKVNSLMGLLSPDKIYKNFLICFTIRETAK